MISFPNCKINLGLRVGGMRADGYHNIETCFYPVPWKDVLEIIPANETKVYVTGNLIPGFPDTNIVFKAYELLKQDFLIGSVEIHLHKIIPTGAGLGGGSSDGAKALIMLNTLFELGISKEKLAAYALQLGSDCPFFLEATPMLATGRGEALSPVSLNLKGYTLAIVKPPIHVSTADAYQQLKPATHVEPGKSLGLTEPVSKWRLCLKNDFEESVFMRYPAIEEIKNQLYQLGAVYASMSGSGSAIYGLFESQIEIEKEFPSSICWTGLLS